MASQTIPEVVIGYPMPHSSTTPPPSPPRGWWSRPISTYPAPNDRNPTLKEFMAYGTPFCSTVFTYIAIVILIHHRFVENAHCHTKFSIQSIAVTPSSSTWHVTFLVQNPSSWYSIFNGGDETAVRLGPLNAAVLNTSHERKSPSYTAFSVDFVAEGNTNDDVVSKELYIKLRATYKVPILEFFNHAGHVEIRCHNLTRSHENVEKIHCHSSYKKLKTLGK